MRARRSKSSRTSSTSRTGIHVQAPIARIAYVAWRIVVTREFRRSAIAVMLLIFAGWAIARIIPAHATPREPLPIVGALPPSIESHTAANGYVLSLSLNVASCSRQVTGTATVELPREYFRAEHVDGRPQPAHPLFGMTLSDTHAIFRHLSRSASPFPYPKQDRSWSWLASDPFPTGWHGRMAAVEVSGWRQDPGDVEFTFEANWLRPRSYGSCWLSIPDLVGPDVERLNESASDSANETIRDGFGASALNEGKFSFSFHSERRRPDGTAEHKYSRTINYAREYISSATPASIGRITLNSDLSVVPGESGPTLDLEQPTWTCREPPPKEIHKVTHVMPSVSSVFPPHGLALPREKPSLQQLEASGASAECGAWIALTETGAQSSHDLWILAIGATSSVGVALLVEALLVQRNRPRRKRRTNERSSSSTQRLWGYSDGDF
jgi:hypothetical protein